MSILASVDSYEATKASIKGGHDRREEEWEFQVDLAEKEIEQVEKQIAAATIRVAIAEKELKNHELQISNAQEVDTYMKNKFTNKQLYNWMVSQISALYFQSYQLAYDLAKLAEKAFQQELGVSDTNFIQFGYWDSLKKGLLAGEKLHYDLKRMEVAYLEQNKREYEIIKHVSLAMLDPVALIKLKETGKCFINIPEAIFDLDYPGHYMRRIKSVSLTIPCVTGPYTNVSCTLTLQKHKTRIKSNLSADSLKETVGAVQSIATSSARNDSGTFELNFRDERYLPFEGAGAISQWHIELPTKFKQFDYETISDIIFHINYTARDGGSTFKGTVSKALQDALEKMKLGDDRTELMQIFSAKHEFSSEWHRFLNPTSTATTQKLELDLDETRFPIMFKDKKITIGSALLFLKLKYDVDYDDDNSPLKYDLKKDGATEIAEKKGNEFKNAVDENGEIIDELLQAISFQNQNKNKKPGTRSFEIKTSEIPECLKDENRLNAKAIEDLLIVFQYSVE